MLKGLRIFKQRGVKKEIAKIYINLGVLHYDVRDYKVALQYYRQNLSLRKELGSTQNIQGVYNNMGLTYLQLAKLDSAQYFLQKSVKLSLEKNDFQTLAQAYNNQGLALTKEKKYIQAVELCNKALQYSEKVGDKLTRQDALENLSNAYAKMEQYDNAFKYFDDYKGARDSLETNFRKAMDYKENYEKEKHQRELLEKDQKIKNAEFARLKEYSFRQTLANYFFGVGLLLSLIIVFAIIKNYQERRKVRQKQQRIDKLLNDQEFLALSKMLEGQEKERERVAQDLHDRLGGMLSVLQYQFTTLNNVIDWGKPEDKEVYSKALTLLDETCDSVRKVSHNIASKALKEFGLIPALNDLKVHIEATKHLTVEITDVGFEQRLPAKYEAQVYRIVQELLGNVLKHANAQEVGVQLYWKHEEANLHISVEDDGRGFDVAQAQAKRGIGLAGLKSRVKSLVGTYSIDSSLGKGTTVMIDIPVLITPNEIEETKQLKQ
jgi:signal transduction histidine kinase